MILALAIGVPVAVAVAFIWIRTSADRTNRRSMVRYGSGLGRLGDITSRSDAAAAVHLPPPTEIARPHIGLEPSIPEPDAQGVSDPVRARLVLPLSDSGGPLSVPVFDDVHRLDGPSGTGSSSGATAALARMVERSRSQRGSVRAAAVRPPGDTESVRLRRIGSPTLRFGTGEPSSDDDPTTTGAISAARPFGRARLPVPLPPAVVARRARFWRLGTTAAALLVIAGVPLYFGTRHLPSPPVTATTTTTIRAVTTTTAAPSVLRPVSVTSKLVVYRMPTRAYVVRFSATGTCWLGSQDAAGAKYLWMDTLSAGATTTYRATGTRIIRVGAPRVLSLSVNGIPVQLPTNVQPYNIELDA